MSLNFVSFDFQRDPNDVDITKVIVPKPKKKKQMSKPPKTKVKI